LLIGVEASPSAIGPAPPLQRAAGRLQGPPVQTARVSGELVEAYSRSGAAWALGPARIYDRLAEVLVAQAPSGVAGRVVLDVGAGTGAASRALRRAGGQPVACDVALGMLTAAGDELPPAALADARHLPFATGSVDGVVAAFSINHLPDPATALAEAARATRRGGFVLVSAYAADDDHPVKAAVRQAIVEAGWESVRWYDDLQRESIPHLATPEGAAHAARSAGLDQIRAEAVEVALPELAADDLVAWRLGMAHIAPFVDAGGPSRRSQVEARARELLGEPPPLVRRIVVLCAVV
jgi:SAM-dependent methyltransferase